MTDLDGVTLVLSDSEIPRMIAVNALGEKVSASAAIVGAAERARMPQAPARTRSSGRMLSP